MLRSVRGEDQTRLLAGEFITVFKDAPVGEWIALSHTEDRIVATAVSLEDAMVLATERGEDSPIMMKVPAHGLVLQA